MRMKKYQMGMVDYLLVFLTACVASFALYVYWLSSEGVKYHKINGYTVVEIDDILSPAECDRLIKYSESQKMVKSEVVDKGGGSSHRLDTNTRNSKTLWIKDKEHELAMKMANTANKWTNHPISHQEDLQVVRYEEGGKFEDHYDTQYGSTTESRCATLLVYLNDNYDGGGTTFPEIGLTILPKKGKGILFWTLDDKNKIIPLAKHRGEKVFRGNKWICTKWTHIKPFTNTYTKSVS